MENAMNYVETTETEVKNEMGSNYSETLGRGNDMETDNNQLITVENEIDTIESGVDFVKKEKIYNDMMIAQENAFIEVDQNDFEEDSKSIEIYNEIQNIKKSGAFVPIKGLKLLSIGNEGTMIFAKRIAKGGGFGNPVLVFVYTDGSMSDDVEIKIGDLLIIAEGNYGEPKDNLDKDDIADAKKLIKQISGKIISYYAGDIRIMPKELIKLLVKNLSTLPVDKGNELDVDTLYAVIMKYIEKVSDYPTKSYIKRKSVYALTHEDMEEIVMYLGAGIKIIDVVSMLRRNNILHLQASAKNQCEVKGVGSCYCIKIFKGFKHEDYVDFNFDPNELL